MTPDPLALDPLGPLEIRPLDNYYANALALDPLSPIPTTEGHDNDPGESSTRHSPRRQQARTTGVTT
jgi:hypothetical protein